jgi:signal transduction histidine kinase
MSMADRLDPSPTKRVKTLEAQAKEAQQTIEELRARDALKTQFLSNVSHDLRTPLAAIITHAEILREGMLGELNQKQRDSVSGIVSGGQQLIDMIDEILTYVRSASDQVNLVRTDFDITELVDQVRTLNQATICRRSTPIATKSSTSSEISSATQSSSHRMAAGSGSRSLGAVVTGTSSWLKSATTAAESREHTTSWCSVNSPRSTHHRRVRITVRVSGWRSRAI